MVKFEFSVKTRDGQRVNSIVIMGSDLPHAERKLRQMYRQCEVLRCGVRGDQNGAALSLHDLVPIPSVS